MPALTTLHSNNCTPWLSAYAEFHMSHRHTAPRLAYTCRPIMKGTHNHCLGVGDRFRHIFWMLRFCAKHRRILLIDWASPYPIEDFFGPVAGIDWRLTAGELLEIEPLKVFRWDGNFAALLKPNTPIIRTVGNTKWNAPISKEPSGAEGDFSASSMSCLWQFVFLPSPELQHHIGRQQQLLFGRASYASIHLRLGDTAIGAAFSAALVPKFDVRLSPSDALAKILCVRRTTGLPVFLATDNAMLKRAVRERNISTLAGQNAAASCARCPTPRGCMQTGG